MAAKKSTATMTFPATAAFAADPCRFHYICGAGGVPSVAGGGAVSSDVRNLLAIAPPMACGLSRPARERRSGDALLAVARRSPRGLAAGSNAVVLYIYSLRTGARKSKPWTSPSAPAEDLLKLIFR
jgi:hypothetical protein